MKFFVLFLLIPQTVLSLELFSGAIFAAGAALFYYGPTLKHIAFCRTTLGYLDFYECCGSPWVTNDVNGLFSTSY